MPTSTSSTPPATRRGRRHALLAVFAWTLGAFLLSPAMPASAAAPDAAPPAPPAGAEPAEVVDRLHATLLDIMQRGEDLGFAGRYQTVGEVLQETFDFQTIARIVTGRYWREASAEQRDAFIATFTRLSAATYAERFADYAGEAFETQKVEDSRTGKVVKTQIVKADGETVSLDYVLQETGGGWRIINVIADGVSDLSLKRAEYTSAIKDQGFDSLIERLDDKIAAYSGQGS